MTRIRIFSLSAMLVVGVAALGQGTKSAGTSVPEAQQSQPPPTIASTVDQQISGIEKQIVDAAEAMPRTNSTSPPRA